MVPATPPQRAARKLLDTGGLSSVGARYGSLAETSWTPQFEIALSARRQLGLEPCEAETLIALLISHRRPGVWESMSQQTLANRRGVKRTTLNKQLTSLRSKGMIAVRSDEAHRPQAMMDAPYFYCADPYLVALGKIASRRAPDALLRLRLSAEADSRLALYLNQVSAGQWSWRLGLLTASTPDEIAQLVAAFSARHDIGATTGDCR